MVRARTALYRVRGRWYLEAGIQEFSQILWKSANFEPVNAVIALICSKFISPYTS